jgi:predicted phosphodiesterase
LLLRKTLKFLVKITIILALLYGAGRFFVVFTDSRLTGERAPYVQMTTENSAVIRWMTEENQMGVVRYGEDEYFVAAVEIESSPRKNHAVKLTGLKPGTKYYYHAGGLTDTKGFDRDQNWFYTHPEQDVPSRIWIIGDSGKPGDTVNQVRDAALDWMRENPRGLQLCLDPANPDMGTVLAFEEDWTVDDTEGKLADAAEVTKTDGEQDSKVEYDHPKLVDDNALIDVWISLGDIAYRSGTNKQFQKALFDTFEGQVANTALWPVYGNHDSRRWTYFRIFELPEYGEAGGVPSDTENYYSFDYSNIHFVMLDSQSSSRELDGNMALWLREDLAKNTKPWLVAIFHHPPYTKGTHDSDSDYDSRGRMIDMRKNILPILEEAGVDLVVSGHSHMYERSQLIDCAYGSSADFSDENIVSKGMEGQHRRYIKSSQNKSHQGAIYAVAGSSSKVDQGPLDHPAHHVGLLEAGSMVIDVVDDTLIARFINNKGQVKDSFSIQKKDGYKSDYKGCDFSPAPEKLN